MNNNLILITGAARSGKSGSLKNIENPEGVLYVNTENNKGLPFKNNFKILNVTDPYEVYDAFDECEKRNEIHTIVIDSITYLLEMFETLYIHDAPNGLNAWADYGQYYRKLMATYVSQSTKNVIATGHTVEHFNRAQGISETIAKVKGSLNNTGIESGYSLVIAVKKLLLEQLEPFKSPLLTITEDDELSGFKYVYQTRVTKETMHDRIGSPIGMWGKETTFIDADINQVLKRIREYHK